MFPSLSSLCCPALSLYVSLSISPFLSFYISLSNLPLSCLIVFGICILPIICSFYENSLTRREHKYTRKLVHSSQPHTHTHLHLWQKKSAKWQSKKHQQTKSNVSSLRCMSPSHAPPISQPPLEEHTKIP